MSMFRCASALLCFACAWGWCHRDDPAYTSVLASVGKALEFVSGNDTGTFTDTVASVPALLSKAVDELSNMVSSRKGYSVQLLQNAMM